MPLTGKKILLGITGSIAAYKAILLVRLLVKAGAEVKVILTPAAQDFVSPLVLSTLTNNKVFTGLSDENTWANHVMLGRWADVMLVAPLSCNTLAKMANGLCDNLLLAVYLSATCPVLVAPAMDEDMWRHPSTQKNIQTIQSFGNNLIPVEHGALASGLTGEGRMAEPEQLLHWVSRVALGNNQLKGRKVLVTAGPTQEAIDPVRFISNHSSGKMGFALAAACWMEGAEVTVVTGPVPLTLTLPGIQVVPVTNAAAMFDASIKLFPQQDLAILCAAVADYTPAEPASHKIKKSGEDMNLHLVQTKDILKTLGQLKQPNQYVVGFALETQQETTNALAKLQTKNADLIVLNSMQDQQATFGFDTNKVTVFDRAGRSYESALDTKQAIAEFIVHIIIQNMYAKA